MTRLALVAIALFALYVKRACIGCALIDLGARLLPEPDLTGDEVDELITRAIVDYHNRTNGFRVNVKNDYSAHLP